MAPPSIDEDYLSRGFGKPMLGGDLENKRTSTEYAIHEDSPMISTRSSAYESSSKGCKITFEKLPSEILLKIVTKLPYDGRGWACTIKGWEKFFEIGYHVLKWIHIWSVFCNSTFTLTIAPDLLPKELWLLVRFTTLIMFDNLRLTPELGVPCDIPLIEDVIPSVAYEHALEIMLCKGNLDRFTQAIHKRNPNYLNLAEKHLQNCVQEEAERCGFTHNARLLPIYVYAKISNDIYANYGIEGDLDRSASFTLGSYKFRITKLGAQLQKTFGDKTVCSALKDLDLSNRMRG